MKVPNMIQRSPIILRSLILAMLTVGTTMVDAQPLKLHALFTDHMVVQRDAPIPVWGWAKPGQTVEVTFGEETAEATAQAGEPVNVTRHEEAYQGLGRWEVTFPARPASSDPTTLVVKAGDESISLKDILVGDVWFAHGQSNMGWGVGSTVRYDITVPTAEAFPLLRHFGVASNTHASVQDNLPPDGVQQGGWVVSNSETARNVTAIGHHFGVTLQGTLQIPIGIICNSRGGASIESMVPGYKFPEDPITETYMADLQKRIAEFDHRGEALKKWEQDLEKAKKKNQPEEKWPAKPEGYENLSSWAIPGVSPADGASVWNGMVAPLKGIPFKGMIFHQGYNNTLGKNFFPKRYRVLMKLMVEGWREEFGIPDLPVGVIGFCAGDTRQHEDNFEVKGEANGAFIREAQRLGLADVENQKYLAFLPAYDVQYPGLHPGLKQEHGVRAARWALTHVYELSLPDHRMNHRQVSLKSAEPSGDEMILTFSGAVMPVHLGSIPRGFSIAGEDGKFYRAYARYRAKPKQNRWDNANDYQSEVIHVWSPLVEKPVAVRYAWAVSPEGNLMAGGHPDVPFYSFRTDTWDAKAGRERGEPEERLQYRKTEEAKRAVEILERLDRLGKKP